MTDTQVLVVDDEMLNLEILVEYFADEPSLLPVTADGGLAAWRLLQDRHYNFRVILLDRMMPDLDGIGLLKRIKAEARLAGIPVIMQTAASSPSEIREGLEAGAYYYLTKPYRRENLLAIVHAALADAENRDMLRRQLHGHIKALHFLERAEFTVSDVDQAAQLASFIAQTCPNPDTAVIGISELLINGIEHGNLGLSYEEKSHLKRDDTWRTEVDRRSRLPENADKKVSLSFRRNGREIMLRVSDQGRGFDWRRYLDIDPNRAFDPNGRGIALARMMSFTTIHYEGCGNVAVATIACDAGAH